MQLPRQFDIPRQAPRLRTCGVACTHGPILRFGTVWEWHGFSRFEHVCEDEWTPAWVARKLDNCMSIWRGPLAHPRYSRRPAKCRGNGCSSDVSVRGDVLSRSTWAAGSGDFGVGHEAVNKLQPCCPTNSHQDGHKCKPCGSFRMKLP